MEAPDNEDFVGDIWRLKRAIRDENRAGVTELLARKPYLRTATEGSEIGPLEIAGRESNPNFLRWLLEQGLPVDYLCGGASTGLSATLSSGPVENVHVLLDFRPNPNLGRALVSLLNRDCPDSEMIGVLDRLIAVGGDLNLAYSLFGVQNEHFTVLDMCKRSESLYKALRDRGALHFKELESGVAISQASAAPTLLESLTRVHGESDERLTVRHAVEFPNIELRVVRPSADRNTYRIFSVGASSVGETEIYADVSPELFESFDKHAQSWTVKWLWKLATYPAKSGKAFGDEVLAFVRNGEPARQLASGVPFEAWMLAADGQATAGTETIQLRRCVPVFSEEADFEKSKGSVEFAQLFDRMKVSNLIVADRPRAV